MTIVPDATPPETCKEKAALLNLYQITTRRYSEAVTELNSKIGTSTKEEFQALRYQAKETNQRSRMAMNALYDHIDEHGC